MSEQDNKTVNDTSFIEDYGINNKHVKNAAMEGHVVSGSKFSEVADNYKRVKQIQQLMNEQNNRCTADPIFVVYQKRKMSGVDTEFTDLIYWYDSVNCEEADEDLTKALEGIYQKKFTEEVEFNEQTYRRYGYIEVDEFVTVCFTDAAAKEFVEKNKHNLRKPFTYVHSLWNNPEMKFIRNTILTGF